MGLPLSINPGLSHVRAVGSHGGTTSFEELPRYESRGAYFWRADDFVFPCSRLPLKQFWGSVLLVHVRVLCRFVRSSFLERHTASATHIPRPALVVRVLGVPS